MVLKLSTLVAECISTPIKYNPLSRLIKKWCKKNRRDTVAKGILHNLGHFENIILPAYSLDLHLQTQKFNQCIRNARPKHGTHQLELIDMQCLRESQYKIMNGETHSHHGHFPRHSKPQFKHLSQPRATSPSLDLYTNTTYLETQTRSLR